MNRGTDSILSVYSDARAEYTKQLCVFLVPAYFQFFTELLEKAKLVMANEPKKILWQFQNYLNEIHDWNIQKVNSEINTININCGCDYLDDLLTAVFIAHTKVLTAIRLSSNNKKVEINIPKVEHFLFKVLCETSKLLWSSTYLFRDGIPGIEKQQNYRMIEQLINEGILQAVRGLVPVKSILKDFVNNDSAPIDDEEDSDDEKETEQDSDKPATELNEVKNEVVESEIPQAITLSETQASNEAIIPAVQVENSISEVKNEIVEEQKVVEQSNQTIIIDEKPGVRFGEFDAVFDSDHPMESDLIYDPKDGEEDFPALEILEDSGVPLADDLGIENLDENKDVSESLAVGDYEEL